MHPSTSKEHAANHPARVSSGGATTDLIGGLVRVLMSLPTGLRALALLVILTMGGFIAYEKFVVVDPVDSFQAGAAYLGGVPDPNHPGADTLNPQNIEAAHKADEDGSALAWHFNHKTEDDPSEVAIDAGRQIYYRYFASSDHCVYIRRRDGVRDLTQWVRDPSYHTHDVDKRGTPGSSELRPAQDNKASASWALARSLGGLLVVASAATRLPGEITMREAQTNSCLNPHPGQFRYWWGPPNDQCNSPMYRQFADGCTHYQLYNRCANAWDSRIFWTTCVSQHKS